MGVVNSLREEWKWVWGWGCIYMLHSTSGTVAFRLLELTFLPPLREARLHVLVVQNCLSSYWFVICAWSLWTWARIHPAGLVRIESGYACSTKLGGADWSSCVLYTRNVVTSYVRPVLVSRFLCNYQNATHLNIYFVSVGDSLLLFFFYQPRLSAVRPVHTSIPCTLWLQRR